MLSAHVSEFDIQWCQIFCGGFPLPREIWDEQHLLGQYQRLTNNNASISCNSQVIYHEKRWINESKKKLGYLSQALLVPRWILGSNSGETFPNKFCSTGCKGHLLEKVLNRFQLITLTIMIPLADAPFFGNTFPKRHDLCEAETAKYNETRYSWRISVDWR